MSIKNVADLGRTSHDDNQIQDHRGNVSIVVQGLGEPRTVLQDLALLRFKQGALGYRG